MRPPQVLREGTKKTVFVNFMDLCKTYAHLYWNEVVVNLNLALDTLHVLSCSPLKR